MTAIDPELLTTFSAVLEHGRIAAAARAIHLSQPAVSARIQKLERTLGTTLLLRSSRGVSPTPAGQKLLAYAHEIEALLERAAAEVGDSETMGPLELIASTTIAALVLPRVLADYRRHHPDVEIELRIGNTEDVIEAVRSGRCPLGLVEGHRRASAVHLEPWLDDDLELTVGRGAPRAWRPRTAKDLEQVPLLWREPGSGTRTVIARALRAEGARGKPQRGDLVLGSNEAIANGVVAGLGLAFLSRWTLAAMGDGRLLPVPGFDLTIRRTFHFAQPTRGVTGTAAHFQRFAQRHKPR